MNSTLSEKFDVIYKDFKNIVDGDGNTDSEGEKSAVLNRLQITLEETTRTVSALEMFSKNEVYEEMDSKTLKFLLLPYLLGAIWQQKRGIDRKDIWLVAEVYFKDFLDRLLDVGILLTKPNVLTLIEREEEMSEEVITNPPRPPLTGDEIRRIKVARFRQHKELDSKIEILTERQRRRQDEDPSTYQELYLSLLRKYALEAEAELESILVEKQLVSAHLNKNTNTNSVLPPKKSKLPFETFIITTTKVQKATFGRGYPSVPVMTVEELYRDRVRKGIWAKPKTTPELLAPAEDTAEAEAELEAAVDPDDETLRAQQDRMDEYKDTHRRGWGNRMNRS